jgi:hypothetical protein
MEWTPGYAGVSLADRRKKEMLASLNEVLSARDRYRDRTGKDDLEWFKRAQSRTIRGLLKAKGAAYVMEFQDVAAFLEVDREDLHRRMITVDVAPAYAKENVPVRLDALVAEFGDPREPWRPVQLSDSDSSIDLELSQGSMPVWDMPEDPPMRIPSPNRQPNVRVIEVAREVVPSGARLGNGGVGRVSFAGDLAPDRGFL